MTLVSVTAPFTTNQGAGVSPNTVTLFVLGQQGNVADYIKGISTPFPFAGRSLGATLLNQVKLEPTIDQVWSIQSLSFQAYLALVTGGYNGTNPPNWQAQGSFGGTCGKVIAGVLFGSDAINPAAFISNPGIASAGSLQPLPQDSTLFTTLWDETQEVPPTSLPLGYNVPSPSVGNLLAIEGSVSLLVPRQIQPGMSADLAVGIWMLPSLYVLASGNTQNLIGLAVCYATYTINYDNGL